LVHTRVTVCQMASSIPPDERLLDLVIALVNTRTRMTKEQVRLTVAGYADAASPDAFERMFERDKDTLRELGIPVVTVTDSAHGDDVGYTIDLDAYALPDVRLTPAELGVLALAAQVWQDGALRTDSTRALTKLRAVTPSAQSTDLVAGLTARVASGGSALAPLFDAIQQRRAVTFSYRAATTGEVLTRHVEPWRLASRRGGWMLVGRDRDRDAPRSFRLARVLGAVRPVGPPGAFDAPAPQDLAAADRSWSHRSDGAARLAVLPDRAEALRARSTPGDGVDLPGRDTIQVPYRDVWDLAEEVVGYGAAVLVLDPPEVRDAVVRLLEHAVTLDGEADRG
jgi:proteasome accessory factor B